MDLGQTKVLESGLSEIEQSAGLVLALDDADENVHILNDEFWVQQRLFVEEFGLLWRAVTVQKIDCGAGFALDRTSTQGECKACPAGMFAGENDLDCIPCPGGTSAPASGSSVCLPCTPSTMSSPERTLCIECAAPSTSKEGSTVCDLCIEGHRRRLHSIALSARPSHLTVCCALSLSAGYFYNAKAAACDKCPAGAVCANAAPELEVMKGHWRTGGTSYEVYGCPYASNCEGGLIGNSTSEELCSEGSTGILCSSCTEGYFHGYDGACTQCDAGAVLIGFVILLVLLVLLVGSLAYVGNLVTKATAENNPELKKTIAQVVGAVPTIKILWSTMQIITSVEVRVIPGRRGKRELAAA